MSRNNMYTFIISLSLIFGVVAVLIWGPPEENTRGVKLVKPFIVVKVYPIDADRERCVYQDSNGVRETFDSKTSQYRVGDTLK